MIDTQKKCIVTGGAGFIGSHLTELLLERGHSVVIIDNLSNGRLDNLKHLENNPNLKVILEDVSNFDAIKNYFQGIDWVFHLAALADIVPSIVEPLKYHKSNVDGTISVLEASRLAGIKKLVYTASSSCYGIPDNYPTNESAAIRPEYPYALTKYLGEQIALHWGQVYKLPIVTLRLFNVYGPRTRTSGTYGAVFGVFLAQKLNNQPYTVVGDGTQTRDFVFVKDVARAFLAAAESNATNDFFNVGTGNPQSVNRLIELLGGEKIYIPKRPGEPMSTHADISKIQRVLEWKPQVSFEEGVNIMLQNINYWREAPVWTPEKIAEATKEWFKNLSKDDVGSPVQNVKKQSAELKVDIKKNTKKTILDLQKMKEINEKIAYLVTYDFHTAKYAEEAGMDMILCGDSVGMSIYGYDGTIPVAMDQMIFHTEAVRRGAPNTFLVGDMPFGSYQTDEKDAVLNAMRFYKEAGVDAIKLEGGVRVAKQIRAIADAGMNVMGHIGLTPQSSGQLGGFKAQGRTAESALKLIEDALAVEKAGVFALLVEAVPPEVTQIIAKQLKIPVLSIGAGPLCDGQLILDIDLIGRGKVFTPKFVKIFTPQALDVLAKGDGNLDVADITLQVFKEYVKEVKAGIFPDLEKHCYKMIKGELEKLLK